MKLKTAPADVTPTKPFGSTKEGVVRAPHPEEMLTSTKNELTAKDRALLGMEGLPSPERQSLQAQREQAIAEGYHHRAETIADEVIGCTLSNYSTRRAEKP